MMPPPWVSRDAEVIAPPRRQDLIVEPLNDELVLSNPDTGEIAHLNGTAIEIWNRCDGATSTRQIAEHLATRWDTDVDTALDDVEQIVTQLAELGLLQRATESC